MGWLVFIHCINSAEASETQLRWTAVTSNNVGAAAESSCLKSGLTNRRMSEKWAPIKQQTQELMWEMLLYVLLPTNASRMKNEINSWLQAQSNQQPYSLAANSRRLIVDGKVSDSSVWLMLMHYGETGILRASRSLRQLCLTYADALHFDIEKTRYQGSQRTSKWELGCATLEIPVPLRALLFHHP